jgi:hypothetical protein
MPRRTHSSPHPLGRVVKTPRPLLGGARSLGELPGFRLANNVLRFDADELDAWLTERRGPAYARGVVTAIDGRDRAG